MNTLCIRGFTFLPVIFRIDARCRSGSKLIAQRVNAFMVVEFQQFQHGDKVCGKVPAVSLIVNYCPSLQSLCY